MNKPSRKPTKAYYEARDLIAELYGMSDHKEDLTPEVPLSVALQAACDDHDD